MKGYLTQHFLSFEQGGDWFSQWDTSEGISFTSLLRLLRSWQCFSTFSSPLFCFEVEVFKALGNEYVIKLKNSGSFNPHRVKDLKMLKVSVLDTTSEKIKILLPLIPEICEFLC